MLQEDACSHISILDLLPPAWDRLYRRSDQVFALRIIFQTIDGLLPLSNVQVGEKLECELRVTLFDITYKQFFGKTWISPKIDVKMAKDIKIHLNKSVYFHTSFADQSIALVVEIIFSQSPNKIINSGWTFLRIFQTEGEISDINSSGSPSHHRKLDIYNGSPRALLFLEEPIESNRYLQKIIGCQLQYQIMTHSEMLKVLHLVSENVIVGGNDFIPGLLKDKHSDAMSNIKIDKGNVINLEKVVLLCENIEKFEDELCQLMNDDRLNRENMTPDGSELTVIERRLQIGVHNGWSYVQEPQIHHLIPDTGANFSSRNTLKPEHRRSSSIISKCSASSTLVLRNKVTLTECPENCSVVFLLEYVLSFPVPTYDRREMSPVSQSNNLSLAGSDDEVSLKDNISSIKSKRPASAAIRSLKRAPSPKSPRKQHFTSSPSKVPFVEKQEEQLPEVAFSSEPYLPIIPVIAGKTVPPGPKALSRAGYAQLSELLSQGHQVYFSFQFYRFPPVVTERLLLEGSSSKPEIGTSYPLILQKTNKDGSKKENSDPGFQIRYNVDTQFLHNDEEHKVFMKYLSSSHLFIDAWDANSLLFIGSTSVSLNCLFRKGKSAIQVISEFEIVNDEYMSSIESDQFTNAHCQLHIRLANVGRPMDPEAMKQKLNKNYQNTAGNQIKRFQPLMEEDKQLLNLINSYSGTRTSQMSDEKKRKLARMDALKLRKGIPNDVENTQAEDHLNKMEILKIVDNYRNNYKDEIIRSALCQSVSTNYTIFPSLGNVEVILHSLVNNSSQSETIIIESSSPLFSVITDYKEWLHFKETFRFNVNIEEDMFSTSNQDITLFLRSKEKVIIPFKYHQILLTESTPYDTHDAMKSMITEAAKIKVTMKSTSSKKTFSVMNVDVYPQPIISHKVLKFHHPENSFFKTFLQIPSHVRGQLSVQCSDKDVICGIENENGGVQRKIYIKVTGSIAGSSKTVYVFLYADRFSSHVVFSWKFTAYYKQKVDICCTEGQTCRTSLILRGHSTTHSLRSFSSDKKCMAIEPAQSFILPAGALQEIHLGIRVMEGGTKYMLVNVVDEEYHQLFKSWLICVRSERQTISKAFQVNLPVGSAKSAKKRVKFTNPYSVRKAFTVQTNRADLLQIKDSRFELDANDSYSLGLYFLPCQKQMIAEVLVFINNVNDENEETFCIRAVFS
ncbi:Nephrocystin-4 [Nymphon striatum]|nr:Nephrocystin-4 [Nymphon striatum]